MWWYVLYIYSAGFAVRWLQVMIMYDSPFAGRRNIADWALTFGAGVILGVVWPLHLARAVLRG